MNDAPKEKGITPSRALFLYLICVFLGGALLAPWVYLALKELGQHSDIAAGIAAKPFRAIVNRTVYLVAIIGMWPLIRALRIGSWREIGWWRKPGWANDFAKGLALGSALLLVAAGAAFIAGATTFTAEKVSAVPAKLLTFLATAIFVSILEETFFRGAIFHVLRRASNVLKAIWLTSAIYAIFHFFARPVSPSVIEWNSGLVILGRMLAGFVDPKMAIPGFLSLTLLGLIFNLAYMRTGAHYLSIGMHAALIFWSKVYIQAATVAPGSGRWFWGTTKITDGWFCFALLLIATFIAWRRKPVSAS